MDWNFALDNSLVQYLAAGETITATYRISGTDDSGTPSATATQDVTVTITGSNDAPTITTAIEDIKFTRAGDPSSQDLAASGSLSLSSDMIVHDFLTAIVQIIDIDLQSQDRR